jgi:hypothetical protein
LKGKSSQNFRHLLTVPFFLLFILWCVCESFRDSRERAVDLVFRRSIADKVYILLTQIAAPEWVPRKVTTPGCHLKFMTLGSGGLLKIKEKGKSEQEIRKQRNFFFENVCGDIFYLKGLSQEINTFLETYYSWPVLSEHVLKLAFLKRK